MKNQALFSSKDKNKKLKCHLLQFLFGALRVNSISHQLTVDSMFCAQWVRYSRNMTKDLLYNLKLKMFLNAPHM